jgi:hypothetical protein
MSVHTSDTTERPEANEEEFTARIRAWWLPWLVATIVAALVIGVGSFIAYGRDIDVASMDTSMDMGGDEHVVPPVPGFYDGREILFIHTEASDQQVADMLSDMMDSPVIVVARLGDVPASVLGDVYVFANGVQHDDEQGPFGFQPDVFDSVPGDDDYSPLRAVSIVTWQDDSEARTLRSVGEIDDAEAAGELTIEQPGVVVNMPIIEWPGGSR